MIEFNNVSFEYGDGTGIVSDLDLKIRDGEVILLCGESGCGKSTLIRMINGLIPKRRAVRRCYCERKRYGRDSLACSCRGCCFRLPESENTVL